MLFEKYDALRDMLMRGPVEVDDLGGDVVALLKAREAWYLQMILLTRCMAAECCAEAKGLIAAAYGGVLKVGTTDTAQELNDLAGYAVQWNQPDTDVDGGADFHHTNAGAERTKGYVDTAGLTRLYACLSYYSPAPYFDTSIRVSFRVNGSVNLPVAGRHGLIRGTAQDTSSSSVETWAMLQAGDYVEVLATQNGAAGVVRPIANESIFIMERRPQ